MKSSASPKPGRPRSADADRAILLYRRYRDREALVEAAVRHSFAHDVPAVAGSGDALEDVIDLLANTIHMLKRTPVGPVLRAAVPHLPRAPALGRLATELGQERRRRLRAAMRRAVAVGAVPADLDIDTVLDGILGAIYFRYLVTGRRLDRGYARRLLEALTR